LKLIACSACHTQYDVSEMAPAATFECRCGVSLIATPPATTDAPAHRCSACGAIAREADEVCGYCGSGIVPYASPGSLICPECYARNLEDARFCLGCGVAFAPERPPSNRVDLRCPCCDRWMTSREVGGLEIQECPKCHGLWAPEDRFDSLVDRAAAARKQMGDGAAMAPRVDGGNPAAHRVEYRRCPACDALMGRRNYQKRSGVIIDRCPSHGTWLDAHELERIAGFVLSGRAESAERAIREEEAERVKAEARRASNRSRGVSVEIRSGDSVFGERSKTSTAETIFDLLTAILN
jgi:Zn-finger nucleic acid-binding protein